MTTIATRARGALLGLAIGDALGMPTQCQPRQWIRERYGTLDRFQPGPAENELSAGLPAGHVTDDTDQAVILGRLFVEGNGHVDPSALARELLAWEERMRRAGSLDLLGPSTIKALANVQAGGSTETSGRRGDTNGAAMRITPIGIGCPADDLDCLVDTVYQAGYVTHNTGIATAGASAIAAAVSTALDGADLRTTIAAAIDAARIGVTCGNYVAGADVAARIAWAVDTVKGLDAEDGLDAVYTMVGAGVATQEAVPAAFAILSLSPSEPWTVCRLAASVGGDCDTIAAMAGAIAGALHGDAAFPAHAIATLNRVNPGLHLDRLASDLLRIRGQARARGTTPATRDTPPTTPTPSTRTEEGRR